jgi:short-subunit dehydrogenase
LYHDLHICFNYIRTGASKGIGRAISLTFNRKFTENTIFVLLARDLKQLNEVQDQLKKESTNNKVILKTVDFSNASYQYSDYKGMLESLLASADLNQISELYVVYNHGSFHIAPIEENAKSIDENFQTNVMSVWKLLTAVRILFEKVDKQYHINLSSLLATQCTASASAYSSSGSEWFVKLYLVAHSLFVVSPCRSCYAVQNFSN